MDSWASSLDSQVSWKSWSHRPQTSQGAFKLRLLLFSTISHYDMSMFWLNAVPLCCYHLHWASDRTVAHRVWQRPAQMFRAGSSATDNEGADRGYLSGYLDPRLQRLPCEPSWPGSPRSPTSTPRSTVGATGPWKTLSAGFVASDDSRVDKSQNCSMASWTANKVNELNWIEKIYNSALSQFENDWDNWCTKQYEFKLNIKKCSFLSDF